MIRPHKNINAHKYPFRNRVTKSFLSADWVCKDDQCQVINIKVHYLEVYINSIVPNQGKTGKVTFRIQKNIQNGRAITRISANDKHQTICPVQLHTIFFSEPKDWVK